MKLKILGRIFIALSLLFCLWIAISIVDVNQHNQRPDDGDPHPLNFFNIAFDFGGED